jgi:hypothetical protein
MMLRSRREAGSRSERVGLGRGGVVAALAILLSGQVLVSTERGRAERAAAERAPRAVALPPAPAAPPDGAVAASPVGTAELPTLVVGPPAPDRRMQVAGGARVTGPLWALAPLPPVPEGFTLADGSALPPPRAIVPRDVAGEVDQAPAPDGDDLTAPPRPTRSAETSAEKPLSLRITVSTGKTLNGPGDWLNVRAAGSAACYVAVFHVDGEGTPTILFPRRFDLVYRPNESYQLAAQSAAGDRGEFLIAVASVYPLKPEDALLALETRAPLVAAPPGSAPPEGAFGAALDSLRNHLRGRIGGPAALTGWERHAWTVAATFHPPTGSAAPPDAAPPDAAPPADRPPPAPKAGPADTAAAIRIQPQPRSGEREPGGAAAPGPGGD